VGPKNPDVASNIAGVEKAAQKTCSCSQHRHVGGHSIRTLNEKNISDSRNFVSSVVGNSQVH